MILRKLFRIALISLFVIAACVENVGAQTHSLLRIGGSAGVVKFSDFGLKGNSVGPCNIGGTVDVRAIDFGSGGALYVGVDYRYIDGDNYFGSEWVDVWEHTAAVRGLYMFDDASRRVNFYAGGSFGKKAGLAHWYKKDGETVTDYRTSLYECYYRVFVGMDMRIFRWLALSVEAGLPTNQLNLGLVLKF